MARCHATVFTMRIREEELQHIEAEAKRIGASVSAFVRDACREKAERMALASQLLLATNP